MCKFCRTCFMFYCMFYFNCDRFLTVLATHGVCAHKLATPLQRELICLGRFGTSSLGSCSGCYWPKISLQVTTGRHGHRATWPVRPETPRLAALSHLLSSQRCCLATFRAPHVITAHRHCLSSAARLQFSTFRCTARALH